MGHSVARAVMALVIATSAAPSRGDELDFARGAVDVPARREGPVVVEPPLGRMEFAAREVARIVPGRSPAEEWPERRDEALTGGDDARLAAAWWALERGLTPEAVAMLRRIGPWVQVLDRLGKDCPDPDPSRLSDFPAGAFRAERGPHVLLLHQGEAAEARERVDLLERVLTTFILVMTGHGLDLPPPKSRLVFVWFARRDDYQRFLCREGAGAFLTTRGYYHPTRHLVAAYDGRDHPTYRRRLDDATGGGSDAPRRRLLLEWDRLATDLGTAAHEMVHQLVAETGLSTPESPWPVWLQEGLAMQFEVVRGGRWAGFGRANEQRLPAWRAAGRPRVVPLVRDVGFDHGFDPERYAAAWALVYYLRKREPGRFVTFIDFLRIPGPEGKADPDRFLDCFRAAFPGDLSVFEADWRRFMAGVRAPLEVDPAGPVRP